MTCLVTLTTVISHIKYINPISRLWPINLLSCGSSNFNQRKTYSKRHSKHKAE